MISFAKKQGSASLAFMAAGAIWFFVGTIYGMFSAIHLVAPEAFNNIAALVFGRSRPVHVNTMVFGFTSAMLVGAALYYVPALLRTKLWSEPLGWVSFVLWQATVLSGEIGFPFGLTQGREYAEYIWPFDVSLTLAIMLLIVNMVMTIANRKEKALYVSVWYICGAAIWTAMVYPIGNVMWNPPTGAMPGIMDSIVLWFYGHNLVGLLLTPLAVGAAYFIVPRITRTPLYSHTLSLIGFWALVTMYTHIGGHHLLQAPIPNWLKVISVVDSIAMIVPVFTVLANIWLTARGKFGSLWNDVAGRFVIVGTMWYLITCIQGPIQSLPSVQKVTHFNNWVVAHAHIAVLGFSGFIALGAMWHVLPMVLKREIYSRRLVSLQFGLIMIGLIGFFIVLSVAGLIQGEAWFSGESEYRVLVELSASYIMRALLGMFIVFAAGIGVYNLFMTMRKGKPLEMRPLEKESPI